MVIFEGMPYPQAYIYIKLAGEKEIVSIPFNEALAVLTDVKFDYRESIAKSSENNIQYVIVGTTEEGIRKTFIVSKAKLIERLQGDIYEDNAQHIADLAIQPEDERLAEEVKELIGI
jgi:hypothetical protein